MAKKTKINKTIKDNKLSNNRWLDIFKILPLLFIVGILPFVIRLKLIPLEGPFYEFWNGEKINADFFTYYKQIFIYIVTIWALLHTFFFTKKIKFTKAYYFMGAYAILVILSTVFSKYPQIALHGFVERKEGMWIILCYLLLTFSTINLVETDKQIKAIIYTLGISGAVISIISIFQYFGMDIFSTEIAKNFMISKEIQAKITEFNIKFGEKYSYGVFYNPNYLGGYISLYAPMMLSFAIISRDIREKAIFGVFFILSIFALYGSRSEAGGLGTAGAIGLLFLILISRRIFHDKPKKEHRKLLLTKFTPILLVIILIPVTLSYMPIDENPLANIRIQTVSLLSTKPPNAKDMNYKAIGPINDIIQNSKDTIEVVINNESTFIELKDKSILSILGKDKEILWKEDLSQIQYNTDIKIDNQNQYEAYLNISKANKENIFVINFKLNTYNTLLNFLVDNQKLSLTDPNYKPLNIEKDLKVADYIGFEGRGSLGSNRGYIWSRSLPIMLNNFIIGTGQDTFITEFPQNDIYARQVETTGWEAGMMVDKPHNNFLQIGTQSGVLSLILILIGLLALIIKSVRNFIFSEELSIYELVSFSIVGFLLSSFFNDSILAITPILYVILATAVKSKLKSQAKQI